MPDSCGVSGGVAGNADGKVARLKVTANAIVLPGREVGLCDRVSLDVAKWMSAITPTTVNKGDSGSSGESAGPKDSLHANNVRAVDSVITAAGGCELLSCR